MELRKQKEREHANNLKNLLNKQEDPESIASNKKFYSITRGSRRFIEKWLVDRNAGEKKFLDYCCGEGGMSIFLARNNADITGIDISDVSIKYAKESAFEKGLTDNPKLLVMDAENLEFENNYFDTIFCSGVLHHLDIDKAYSELARVLKPDGKIICNEPLAYNPLIQLYRKLTPKLRTEWEAEHILTKRSIYLAKKYFKKVDIRFYHLATILAVPFRKTPFFNQVLSFFEAADSILLKIPGIQWLSWQVVYILSEPKK